MQEWWSIRDIADFISVHMPGSYSMRSLYRSAKDWQPMRASKGSGGAGGTRTEYHISALPAPIRDRIGEVSADSVVPPSIKEKQATWAWYERLPVSVKKEAERRLNAITAAERLCAEGLSPAHARETVSGETGIDASTLWRWQKRTAGIPKADRLPHLAPGYGGHRPPANMTPKAWEFFKSDYLRQGGSGRAAPVSTACYRRLLRAAAEHNWIVPSLATLRRRIKSDLSRQAVILAREGEEALMRTYPPQKRDKSVFVAMQAVNGDGWQSNLYVEFPSGEISQPKVWFWQDVYSGKWLVARVDVSENKDLIRLAVGDLLERYGIPELVVIDNTMAAANKWLTGGMQSRFRFKIKEDDPIGILPMCGIDVSWTLPAHGQSKPVERSFGRGGAGEIIDSHPQFAGRGLKSKPIPLEEFEILLRSEMAAFNAQRGRRSQICAGRSYDEVFNESYSNSEIRKATPEQRRLWLLAAEGVRAKATDGSVSLNCGKGPQGENQYWAEPLISCAGQKLVVRFDPAGLHGSVHCYTSDGRYICEAKCQIDAGFNDRAAAQEHARLRARHRKAAKEELQRQKRMTALEAAALLPKAAPSETDSPKVIRPVFAPPPVAASKAVNDDFAEVASNAGAESDANFRKGLEILKKMRSEDL